MCYNCGCHMLQDDHGQPDNITEESIRKAAKAAGQSAAEAKQEILKTLQMELGQSQPSAS